MKPKFTVLASSIALLLTACAKQELTTESSNPTTNQASMRASSPVAAPATSAWAKGDKESAVMLFLDTDWTKRPLFDSASLLGLTEDEFKALPDSVRQARANELIQQVESLRELTRAVAQTGRDALSRNDATLARKCFTSLKDAGMAFASPESLMLVQLIGKSLVKVADQELAGIQK